MATLNSLGIDHPVITVRDLETARQTYTRLGFQLTPRGYHPWGTANHFAMFGQDFLELLGVYDAARLGQGQCGDGAVYSGFIRDFLARREGLSLVALHSTDARADLAAVEARGFQSAGLVDFRRPVRLPDGTDDAAVVTLAMLINTQYPDISTFICQQHKPHLIWVPGWQQHPNAVDGILSVTYVADEPLALRSYYQALYGSSSVRETVTGLQVDTPNGCFDILVPAALPDRFPWSEWALPPAAQRPCGVAVRVRTRDLAAAARCLAASGIPAVTDQQGVLRVNPAHACGIVLEFAAG